MPPTIPINHFFDLRDQQNKVKDLFHYSMLMYSIAVACFEHSIFFKVNSLNSISTQLRTDTVFRGKAGKCSTYPRQTAYSNLKSNYERFNRSNFNIRYWSWNYRGCWHQTCPPIATRREIKLQLIPIVGP